MLELKLTEWLNSFSTVTDLVCAGLNLDECERWKSCSEHALDCCERQIRMRGPIKPGHCPRQWDGYSCWDDTPAGSTVTIKCPAYIEHSIATSKFDIAQIDLIHKFQNAHVPYHKMLHSEQKCAHFCPEWSTVGCGIGAAWDLWNCSIGSHISLQYHQMSIMRPKSPTPDYLFNSMIKLPSMKILQLRITGPL